MESSVKDRLIEFLKYKGIGQNRFAQTIGVSAGYVNNIRKSIQPDKINSIAKFYPELNTGWLLTGEGEMLKPIEIGANYYKKINNSVTEFKPRPHISITPAICGLPNGFEVAVKKQDCEMLPLPVREEYDFSIIAKGDSMINHDNPERSIKAGDYIACRIWTSRSYVRWGEVYALATADGVIVKKVMPSDREGMIKCVSFNEKDGYLPFNLKIDEIFDWALVIAVVSVNKWN